MARALWSGSLSFGLVNVPVQLLSAVRGLDYHFHEMITDEELGSLQPRKTRTIEIESFVDLEQVDGVYFDHPYFLITADDSEGTLRAYRLLIETMASQDRAALGRFVMRTKEYLVAVRAREGALALTTMLFHDELPRARPHGCA